MAEVESGSGEANLSLLEKNIEAAVLEERRRKGEEEKKSVVGGNKPIQLVSSLPVSRREELEITCLLCHVTRRRAC